MADQTSFSISDVIDPKDSTWAFDTHSDGPSGTLPFTEDILVNESSGFHFGMSQNAGMGWNPAELLRKHFLILSTNREIGFHLYHHYQTYYLNQRR